MKLKKTNCSYYFCNSVSALSFTLFLLSIHYLSIQVYSNLCTPLSLYGFIHSIFTVASPPCRFMLFIAHHTSEIYVTSWISMGVSILYFIKGICNTNKR
jgi:hypothetical protein